MCTTSRRSRSTTHSGSSSSLATASARRGLIVLTRDRRIRTRPAERRIDIEASVRSVWIGAKRDLNPSDQLELFLRHEARLRREIVKRGGMGPGDGGRRSAADPAT
ncbi:PIN-like domain-containing protein [Brachybacterium huguangmaarense]